jgi:hypothetical protein
MPESSSAFRPKKTGRDFSQPSALVDAEPVRWLATRAPPHLLLVELCVKRIADLTIYVRITRELVMNSAAGATCETRDESGALARRQRAVMSASQSSRITFHVIRTLRAEEVKTAATALRLGSWAAT